MPLSHASQTLEIRENVPLRDYATFRTGGPARFFCEVATDAQLTEALSFAREKCGGTFFILGGGSNILVDDAGFNGLAIRMNIKGIDFEALDSVQDSVRDGIRVTVSAGENWDYFVGRCVERGLGGIENLSGIPGMVGAAPVQNIGAYGVEVARSIDSVRAFDTVEHVWKNFPRAECDFEYRDSIFKKAQGRFIITSVTFRLAKIDIANATSASSAVNIEYKDLADYFSGTQAKPTPADVRKAVLAIRSKKLPDVREVGTAGSFFKNPIIPVNDFAELKKQYETRFPDIPSFPAGEGTVKVPLAWILDHICGYKGVTKGNVGTYKNQALVIVNNGGVTTSDIKQFANDIIASVKEKTGIDIEPEVQYI